MDGSFESSSAYDPLPETPAERLTSEFYRWEIRGRGWQVWPYPVSLEPPFRPFFSHTLPARPVIDDGRKRTILSTFAEGVRGLLSDKAQSSETALAVVPAVEEYDSLPTLWYDDDRLVELRLSFPPDFSASKEATERFLQSLKYCRYPLSFELIGLPAVTWLQLACREADSAQVHRQFKSYFPDVSVTPTENFLADIWDGPEPA